ncbi:malonyl CoA-acyl carrier protein transacylase [Spirochaetia bacterium]|nr:malonyl CoA-acyl carrier protein transacylase [Spirochaetia bacterium]
MVETSKKYAFLFPGQGAQYQGMALDFLETGSVAVKTLFDTSSKIIGRDMAALLRDSDSGTLMRTDVSQPAITLANLAAAAFLAEEGVRPACVAGFSLGEYAALAVAGVISLEDCFRLVKARGIFMQEAADALGGGHAPLAPNLRLSATPQAGDTPATPPPGMAAVIGLPPDTVEALIAEWTRAGLEDLYAANINSPRQVVISGTACALAEAETRFKEAGARRVLRLQVAGPFHSPLIADAALKFKPVLESTVFKTPAIPLFSNVTGKKVTSGDEAKKLALEQITSPVRWTDEEQALSESGGFDAILETGPGNVLQGLWKDSGSTIPALAAGTVESIRIIK